MCKSQSKVNHLNSKHLNSSTKKFKSLLCSPPLLLPSRIRFGSVFFKKKSKFRTVLFDNSFFPPLTALQNILNNRRILCVLNYDCDKYGSKMKAYENNHTIGLIGMPFGRVAKLSDQMELLLYHLHSQNNYKFLSLSLSSWWQLAVSVRKCNNQNCLKTSTNI